MQDNIAIKVENVSKEFVIPHEKVSTLRGAFVNLFKKKSFERFKALDNVSFEVKKGEFFGIIGRNGSGKSTLLKILSGIYSPSKGKIKVNGRISPFLELGIGFNPELSGRDNIYLNGTVLGLTDQQIKNKFDDIVAFSELERFIDQKVKNYSSGMQVRLAFSVAIHAHRDILLMDEVLAVGDSNFQAKCLAEFNEYRKLKKTVVLVTHDISTVQRYCDRALLLRSGKLVKIGDAIGVGNEYIFQNMADKTKQENEEVGKSPPAVVKSEGGANRKPVEIISVSTQDDHGDEKKVFETGDEVNIKIKFKANQEVEVLNFGVGMHSVFGGQIFGYNTQMDNLEIKQRRGTLSLSLKSLPLLKGDYYLNVGCWGSIEQDHFDYLPECMKISVFSHGKKDNYRGFFDIEHKWDMHNN